MAVLCAEEDALCVDLEDAVPLVGGAVFDGRFLDDDGGVVHEDVELAILADGGCDGALPIGFAGDIKVQVECVATEFVDFGFDLLPLLVEDVAEITTFAPSCENSRASAAPCPRAPPLMRATLPSSLPMVHLTMVCQCFGRSVIGSAGITRLCGHFPFVPCHSEQFHFVIPRATRNLKSANGLCATILDSSLRCAAFRMTE